MKRLLILAALIGICAATISEVHAQSKKNTVKMNQKVLRHVVMFQFKDGTSEADIKKVLDAFAALKTQIPSVKSFEWGTNNSPEGLNQGITHVFLLSFTSEKDRDDYLVNSHHKAFVEILLPHLEKPTVVDYWATNS